MNHRIVWEQSARDDLLEQYDWVTDQADSNTALRYTSRVEAFADKLRVFPKRGTPRFHLGAALRTVTFERRLVIVYRVEDNDVVILRIIHAARDFAAAFRS